MAAAAVAAAAALALSGCAGQSAAPAGSASTHYVPVQIGVGVDAAYAPFFIADQEGLFRKAGLNVKLVQFASGPDAVNAVSSGQISMTASSNASTTSQIASNPRITAIASYLDLAGGQKVVLRKGIDSVHDVKKFGYVAGLSQYMAYSYLKKNGIDPRSIQWVSATAQDMPTLMQRGDIDGFFLWEPWPTNAQTQGVGKIVANAGGIDLKIDNWIVTSHDWYSANKTTAMAVLRVLDEADKKVNADRQAAADATSTAVAIKPADALATIKNYDYKLSPLTDADVSAADDIADFFVSVGSITKAPDLKKDLVLNVSWK